MAKEGVFYTLNQTAGMIRSNKFSDKADAVCVGSYRAEVLKMPVKVIEHTPAKIGGGYDEKTVLVCMPDGSAEKPKDKKEMQEGHEEGFKNETESHMLLSSYEDYPITTYYLKSDLGEPMAQEMEKEYGVELGLYDPRTLHAYTEDSGKLKKIEEKLAEAGLEIDHVRDSKIKREKLQAATELVTAARRAKAGSPLPGLTLKASSKMGGDLKLDVYCEQVAGDGKKSPSIKVMASGSQIGEAKSENQAAEIIRDHVERELKKYLKKELV